MLLLDEREEVYNGSVVALAQRYGLLDNRNSKAIVGIETGRPTAS